MKPPVVRFPRGFMWPWSGGTDDGPTQPAPTLAPTPTEPPAVRPVRPPAPVTPKTIAPTVQPRPKPWQSGFSCVGLCPGDCIACQGLADRITRAKRLPDGPLREDQLMRLERAVDRFMGHDPETEGSR